MHETGKIVYKDKRIAKFFGFSKNEFNNINNVCDIIPKTISEIHEALIHRMLISGL